jgi:hypothetical protein
MQAFFLKSSLNLSGYCVVKTRITTTFKTVCNRAKGSQHVFDYMSPSHLNYSEQRVGKLKEWMEQKPCSVRLTPAAQAIPYICNDATLGWIAT